MLPEKKIVQNETQIRLARAVIDQRYRLALLHQLMQQGFDELE